MLRKHMEIAGKMKAIDDEAKIKSEAGSEYGGMLEMIHNKEPLNSNEIQKEYKNRVSQEQKIFQDNMKQMSRRPEIYRR